LLTFKKGNEIMDQLNQECPYVGLIPFTEADSRYFFGRTKEVNLIIANMFASRLTLLYGKSGVGKSSILNAGVMPELRNRKDLAGVIFKDWRQGPSIGLMTSIYNATKDRTRIKIEPLSRYRSLKDFFHEYLDSNPNIRLMIILDQFEDFFLYNSINDSFSIEFPSIVMDRQLPISFIISIREDSLAKIDRFEGSIPILFDNILKIDSLNVDDAKDAIIKPIDCYNEIIDKRDEEIKIEESLVDSVIDQIKTGEVLLECAGQGVLNKIDTPDKTEETIETPYLQLVMMRLWRKEKEVNSNLLRLSTLVDLGGAKNIIRTHLDDVMMTTTFEEKQIASSVLRYLVTPGGAKISHTIPDLANYTGLSEEEITYVLEKLADSKIRIISPVAPAVNSTALRYEIYHDVLASPILDWRNRFENELRQVEAKRQASIETRKKIYKYGRYLLIILCSCLLALTIITLLSLHKSKDLNNQLNIKISEIKDLNEKAQDRLDRITGSIELRKALLSGNNDQLQKVITGVNLEIQIRFGASARNLGYKAKDGSNTYTFKMFPIENSIPGGLESIALITYYMNHPTFMNSLITAGPNSKFTGSYDGVGCLTRVTAFIEYSDINKPPTVAQFNMCKILGWE
jgi:hypothetical protein